MPLIYAACAVPLTRELVHHHGHIAIVRLVFRFLTESCKPLVLVSTSQKLRKLPRDIVYDDMTMIMGMVLFAC